MFPLKELDLLRGRAGGTGQHLVDPHGEPVAADGRNRKGWQQHGGQKEKREDFHAPAARPSAFVVASGGHAESRFDLMAGSLAASGPLPASKLEDGSVLALIWIKPRMCSLFPRCEIKAFCRISESKQTTDEMLPSLQLHLAGFTHPSIDRMTGRC
jgi:hypothetical protein